MFHEILNPVAISRGAILAQRFWSRCKSGLKSKQLEGFAAASSGCVAGSCTVLCVCKCREENDEQGREFSKQQRNHCCAEAKQLVLRSRSKAKAGAAWLRSSFAFRESTLKLLSLQGYRSTTVFPWTPGCERRPEQALHAPRVLEGCRKTLAKAFAWLPWPITQGLIS